MGCRSPWVVYQRYNGRIPGRVVKSSAAEYTLAMRNVAKFLIVGVFAVFATTWIVVEMPVAKAQAPAPAQGGAQAPAQPTFRVSVDLVTTDVIVRDQRSEQFVADLKPGEFEIYEDGVKQEIVSSS